ncbi:PIH1 domain-containing protein 2-like [Asterias amurensis]|uniref:PIH1 domain-containing protein 2-like n=1 Tax=Asterias amurensis TaxID=7602 RepID=UPI003AB7AF9A
MATGEDDMIKQAQTIWSMLDELADSNPDGYQKFIEKNLSKGKAETEAAKPWMCVKTRFLKPKKETLYMNICSWARIPKPKTSTDPIAVSAGPVEDEEDETGPYKVVRVAVNPDVLAECAKNAEEQDLLIDLAIKYLKEQKKLHLSQNFQICQNVKFKGDASNLKNFFNTKQKSDQKEDERDKRMENLSKLTPDSLLSRLRVSDDQSESSNNKPEVSLQLNGNEKPKSGLIEEIGNSDEKLNCPEFEVLMREADGKRCRRCVVRISLPDVQSVQECELNIAEEEISLLVPLKYEFHLPLPEAVLEDDSSAKFNSKTSSLTLTMPTKQL